MLSLLSLGLLLGIVSSHGDHVEDRGCATTEYMEEMFEKYPEWELALNKFEEEWKSGLYQTSMQTITIPIVFHIVYNGDSQNVPDSGIASQLTTLNEDFKQTNSDSFSGTPPEFRSLRAGDFGITYTNDQVIRMETSTASFSTNNNIKFDSSGGSDVVSPNSKLNFWSGPLSGGLLGYAQFPGGSPSTDGVVNLYSSMAPSVGNPPYNLGRTGTHEIGHWLNLRHIWGDSSSCNINDGVDDTPAQSGPNFGCPTISNAPLSCPQQNPYPYDMYCNYMDYTDDACMVMFSAGQMQRSWDSIDQFRQGFNPSNIIISDIEYVNWLYFIEYDHDIVDDNKKCYGGVKELFYDNNLNENSNSNKFIYGCMHKTRSTNTQHINDIKFIYGENAVCEQGYIKATQDLNIGNNNPIYLCYSKAESSIENNDAVLDITFVRNGDSSKFDNTWTIYNSDNINPNGTKLNFAIKKGAYILNDVIDDSNKNNGLIGSGVPVNADTVSQLIKDSKYIIAGIVGLIGVLIIAFLVWRFVCTRKGFKDAVQQNNEALIYGATEMSAFTEVK